MLVFENFQVISGSVTKDSSSDLDLISETAKDRYASYTTAHHEWIDSVESSAYRSALDRIRTSPDILNKIQERFPGTTITNVTESDEIYWAVSPKSATGSDRSLVDCHYDSPFALFPTGGVVFYRVIIACNENNTVTTVFPDEDKRVKMTTRDFHGLDYNRDWHCVEGSIQEGKYRVLLKMHYIIVPKGSETWAPFVKWMNVTWTTLSRETMRMSADPQNLGESLVAGTVTVSRVFFNHFYTFLSILILAVLVYNIYYNKTMSKMILRTVQTVRSKRSVK
jgi:hypothetical protein